MKIPAINIIHRPELSPEYAERALGGKRDVQDESIDIFRFQQDTAHKYGLRTTIAMTYASLFSDEVVALAKNYHAKYGDEIGLSLLGLPCKQFKEKYKTDDFCIWMFDEETKKEIVDDCFGLFYEKFGFYPESTGSYFLDAFTINYIKEKYPSVKCAIAACWEEGPKAYKTCNHSWYTFLDGGPWNPWIPSKVNSHCPASDKADDCGLVAIPHLSRDLLACFDGNGSNFGTHPQNVLRGLIYYQSEAGTQYPYLYNLIDQYMHIAKFNDGYGYNMMFVGPGWLNKAGRWECPYEILAESYDNAMKYYGKLKKEGVCTDMTMSEFADFYRAVHPDYSRGESALWKDILYGSDKEYYWYIDPAMRCCLDMSQGGAMIDLRPLIGRIPQKVGIGTENVYDASYPYIIQAMYRAGYFTHYAGAGTLKSCRVTYHGQTADLSLCRTMAVVNRTEDGEMVVADPVTVSLDGLDIVIRSTFFFQKGTGMMMSKREILNDLHGEEVVLEEYLTGAFGTTEYQPSLVGVRLGVSLDAKGDEIYYGYKGQRLIGSDRAYAYIPQICTQVSLENGNAERESADERADEFEVEEGIAFSPVFHLKARKTMTKGGMTTWLRLEKAN